MEVRQNMTHYCRPGSVGISVFLLLLFAVAFQSSGQLISSLDPKIPSYRLVSDLTGALSVAGSDTMKPLTDSWLAGFRQRYPGLTINKVETRGADTGLAALLEHRTEVAAISRRMTSEEISVFVKEYGYEPTEVPVANDALAIFVHKDNPITGLSFEELDAIFCRERRRGLDYAIETWGLVGLVDEWFEAPVRLYGRNGKSSTASLFREEVCKGGTFRPQLVDAPGSASVVLDLTRDPQGIGFSAIAYRASEVKPVPIAAVKGGRYVEPTFLTTMDGSYPLKRNLYLYIAKPPKASANPALTEFVRFTLSRQGQQLTLDHGYFPLSLMEITRLTSKWVTSVKSARLETPDRTFVE